MPDPLTSTLRLTEPTIGGDTGLWAGYLNNNMIFTDQGVNQTISVSIPDTNVTLVADGTTSDQARYYSYNFTGALTANRTVTLPNVQRQGWAANNTTAGFNVILSAGGTTLSLPPDGLQRLYNSDGATNVTAPVVGFGNVWQTIANASVSGVSSQNFSLPSVFRRFRLTGDAISVSVNNAAMVVQFSSNGGSTFFATGYYWAALVNDNTNTASASSSLNDSSILITGLLSNSTSQPADITTEIWAGSGSFNPVTRSSAFGRTGSPLISQTLVSGGLAQTSVMNYFKVAVSGGLFSGNLILEALP